MPFPSTNPIASVQEGNKILANGNLYVIELDEDKINPYFLKAYLESENGKAALSRVAVGAILVKSTGGRIKKGDNSVAGFRKSEKNCRSILCEAK